MHSKENRIVQSSPNISNLYNGNVDSEWDNITKIQILNIRNMLLCLKMNTVLLLRIRVAEHFAFLSLLFTLPLLLCCCFWSWMCHWSQYASCCANCHGHNSFCMHHHFFLMVLTPFLPCGCTSDYYEFDTFPFYFCFEIIACTHVWLQFWWNGSCLIELPHPCLNVWVEPRVWGPWNNLQRHVAIPWPTVHRNDKFHTPHASKEMSTLFETSNSTDHSFYLAPLKRILVLG